MWWLHILELVVVFILVYLLDKWRTMSDNESLRSMLDFINGLLNFLLVYLGLLILADFDWMHPLKRGVSWMVRLLGNNLIGTVTMTAVVTALYVALWKFFLFRYVFFAGSNMMNWLLSGGISICFVLIRFADGIDGAKGLWSIICGLLCGFVAFIGLLRVLSALNVYRCPVCHTYYANISHGLESESGSDAKVSYRTDRDFRTESSSEEYKEITTYTTRRTTDYYRVFSREHQCGVCGYRWETHRNIHSGSDSTPYEKEEITRTYR